jgi:SAM-dependent methyltransferase
MAALLPAGRVLDLGVGPGTSALEMARAAPGRSYLGLDVSRPMLHRARVHARRAGVPLSLVRADALRLPFRAATFDGAAGHSVLYLLPDAPAALAELRRTLRPGGRVVFLEPRRGHASLGAAAAGGPRHLFAMALWRGMSGLHRRFDEATLPALLASAGFADARAWPVLSGLGVMATAERPGG